MRGGPMAEVETDGLDEGASSRSMSASSTPRPTMLTQPLMDSDDNDSQASAELAPLGSCAELCEWSSDEAHHMLFACCMPSRDPDAPSVQACSRRWSEYRLCVALNPVYWVGWLCLLPVLLLGKCVHAAFGQHGPISESDTPLEREVRVWWVYPVSGWFSLGLAAVAANAAAYGAEGTLTQFEHWSVLLIAATMYLLYIASSVVLLAAMRRRASLHIKACVAGILAFAAAVAMLFGLSVARAVAGDTPTASLRDLLGRAVCVWAVRGGFVAFFLPQVAAFARLWSSYESERRRPPRSPNTELALDDDPFELKARGHGMVAPPRMPCHHPALLAAVGASVAVLGMLAAASYLNSNELWEALL